MGSIEMVRNWMPSAAASAAASLRELISDENATA